MLIRIIQFTVGFLTRGFFFLLKQNKKPPSLDITVQTGSSNFVRSYFLESRSTSDTLYQTFHRDRLSDPLSITGSSITHLSGFSCISQSLCIDSIGHDFLDTLDVDDGTLRVGRD